MAGKANIRLTEKWHSCACCVAFLRIQYKTFSNTLWTATDPILQHNTEGSGHFGKRQCRRVATTGWEPEYL